MTDFTRLIITLLVVVIVIAIFAITMPANLRLFVLSEDRACIQKDANLRGWDDYLTECWQENLDSVQEVADSSAYGNFIVQSPYRGAIVLAELAICLGLILGVAYLWEPKRY